MKILKILDLSEQIFFVYFDPSGKIDISDISRHAIASVRQMNRYGR